MYIYIIIIYINKFLLMKNNIKLTKGAKKLEISNSSKKIGKKK